MFGKKVEQKDSPFKVLQSRFAPALALHRRAKLRSYIISKHIRSNPFSQSGIVRIGNYATPTEFAPT